jgi:CRP-like cAMP-binding protein
MDALERRLAQHPFLAGLIPAQLPVLRASAMAAEFKAGEVIFRAGDPANRFYLVEEGRVTLESSAAGSPAVIQTIGPGDVLGWSWLFPPYLWNFDARAETETRAIFLYATRLREECEQDHNLGYELMKRMSAVMLERLQATRRQSIRPVPASLTALQSARLEPPHS